MARRRRLAPAATALLSAALAVMAAGVAAADPARCVGAACGRLVYVGTHGEAIQGMRLDEATGHLSDLGPVASVPRPTWLVAPAGSRILYATSETGNDGQSQAQVYSLRPDPAIGALTVVNHVGSGGGGATHLAFDAASRTVFVANYGTGDVAALPVLADGSLAPAASVQRDAGSGPSPRQKGPHAHGVAIAPGGRRILVADLGADRLFVYRVDPATRALTPNEPPSLATPAGSGPRHAVFLPHSPFVYVDSELTGKIAGYRWEAATGRLLPLSRRSTFPEGYAGERSAAELIASADGRFLYVSNRGEDVIVVYAVDRATGALREVQRIAAGGATPWSIGLSPSGRWLLSANEASSTVTVFRVDKASGKLTATAERLAVPKPVSLAFLGG